MENGEIRAYRGDSTLKAAGETISWTQEMVQEWLKCREDIIYFSENYIKIVTEDGLVPIQLRDYQKEYILAMQENRVTMALQARQSGKTEAFRCFALHYILFNEHKTIAVLANKAATAMEILGKIQIAYRALPLWMQQGVLEFNKGSFVLENGCRILASATSSSAIRGFTIHCLILDEVAFIENFSEFYASVLPTITAGKNTKLIMASTPNGLNHYWKFWNESVKGMNNFQRIFVPWWKVPGRDAAWKKETLEMMGHDLQKFAQEQECEFLGSSGTLISGDTLQRLSNQIPTSERDGLKIYIPPVKGRSYVLTGDVSEGKRLDYSAFNVIDVTEMPYNQVATFRNNLVPPAEYADIIFNTASIYNDAAVLVENNNSMGNEVNGLLFNIGYENLLYTASSGSRGKVVSSNPKKSEIGIRTTSLTKAKGCSILKLLIEQQQLIINDSDTILELSRFSRKGKSYEAEDGATDDIVMSLVLFAWLTGDNAFKELTDTDTVARLRERETEVIEEQFVSMGYASTGQEEMPESQPSVIYDDGSNW